MVSSVVFWLRWLLVVMVRMGCMVSSRKVGAPAAVTTSRAKVRGGETIVAALARLDDEISACERTQPAARLAVVNAELDILQQEINTFEETTHIVTKDVYAQTMHQMFVGLDLYRRPMLASENEDFVANVNRKEMQRLELTWLCTRLAELKKERSALHAQILHLRSMYAQLQLLLDRVWGKSNRPGTPQEGALKQATLLRDALAAVSARLRASVEYAHAAVRLLDDALPAWKLTTVGKSGWVRTRACADACRLFVQARCLERGARRVLAAPAAPRAARTLRLALDYAFTDTMHDHKYQRATEIFMQFKEALIHLIDSIHQVYRENGGFTAILRLNFILTDFLKYGGIRLGWYRLRIDEWVLLNNVENLAVSEKEVGRCRVELRAARVNAIAKKGLAELTFEPGDVTS